VNERRHHHEPRFMFRPWRAMSKAPRRSCEAADLRTRFYDPPERAVTDMTPR
jgi:hypothetical protein